MLTQSKGVPTEEAATLQAIISRLEEKCAVVDAAEAAWTSPSLSDAAKLRILMDVRRVLVDAAAELEAMSGR